MAMIFQCRKRRRKRNTRKKIENDTPFVKFYAKIVNKMSKIAKGMIAVFKLKAALLVVVVVVAVVVEVLVVVVAVVVVFGGSCRK